MATYYPRQDYPIQPVNHSSLGQQQSRRRHSLGVLLVGVGFFWFYLRLTGQVGDLSMPICWVEGIAAILDHFNLGCDVPSLPQAAYGMLAPFTIRYVL